MYCWSWGYLSSVLILSVNYILHCQIGILYPIDFGYFQQLFACFFRCIFSDHADGRVLEENYEDDCDYEQRNCVEEENHPFEIGDQEEPEDY